MRAESRLISRDVDQDALRQILAKIDEASRPRTLVSVMTANNETGVIQPMDVIVEIAREAGVAGSDMVQMLGKRHLDFAGSGLDFASLSPTRLAGRRGRRACPPGTGDDKLFAAVARNRAALRHRECHRDRRVRRAQGRFDDIAHYREMARRRDGGILLVRRAAMSPCSGPTDRIGNTSCLAVGERSAETMVMALDLPAWLSAPSACSSGKVHESLC